MLTQYIEQFRYDVSSKKNAGLDRIVDRVGYWLEARVT